MAIQNYGTGGGFQLSPGVKVNEIDLTTIIPAVSTTTGAFAGVFRWGPVGTRVLVTSENDLVNKFGKPTNINPETFFTAANFLAYSNSLYVSRAVDTAVGFSAAANTGAFTANSAHTIKNSEDYEAKSGSFDPDVAYIARYPGELGNSIRISVCDSANQYSSNIVLRSATSNTSFNDANTLLTLAVGSNTATVTLANSAVLTGNTPLAHANTVSQLFNIGDYIVVGNNSVGKQSMKINSIGTIAIANTAGTNTGYASFTLSLNQPLKLSTDISSNTVLRQWEYANQVDSEPGQTDYVAASGNTAANDELHIVVVDRNGGFTGSPGAVLEVFSGTSRATDAKTFDGQTNYYKNVINTRSNYVWFANDRAGATSNTAVNIASSSNVTPLSLNFNGGVDQTEANISFAQIASAYDIFASADDVDISLVLTGKSRGGVNGEQLPNYLIDNLAEVRKDCVVFASPEYNDVVNQNMNALENVLAFRASLRGTSYGVMDSGYKYQYDKYNDLYRWVPLNGDIAGTCVNTDNVRDPWYSPAGSTRGKIKNIIKLAYNPGQSDRDALYQKGINPVISSTGEGTILFGDKTLQTNSSAFDRINVRRLFIVLEKAISRAAKSFLFEFNDEFTRAQFVNIVEPYLRDVQGRRGIIDFRVVCDETNNTPEVIDSNRFVGDLYIKPNRSINFITLSFVAVRTGVEFSTITG